MTIESVLWFAGQTVAGVAAVVLGRRIGRAPPGVWKTAAVSAAALLLGWPLMRWSPALALHLIGAPVLIFIELTGIILPAVLLFSIAALHVRPRDQRALYLLLIMCGIYFVSCGLWMLGPPVPEVNSARYLDGVCRQSTNYTCVAASLVTLLSAHGIDTTETEMARLSYTEIGNGTTDSRAVYALQRKLAGQPLDVRYERMNFDRLQQIELPCVVPIEWGYFTSHMVALLAAGDQHVLLGDPLSGARELSRADFARSWLGRGIYLHDRRKDSGSSSP